jgi:hypothetical protein
LAGTRCLEFLIVLLKRIRAGRRWRRGRRSLRGGRLPRQSLGKRAGVSEIGAEWQDQRQ